VPDEEPTQAVVIDDPTGVELTTEAPSEPVDDEELIQGILERIRELASPPRFIEHDFALGVVAPHA
jgi:hypothetical protein